MRFSLFKKCFGLTLLVSPLALSGCGSEDCAPVDYAGGSKCGPEGKSTLQCNYDFCIEGPICREGWFVHESDCPSFAPACVEAGPHDAICVGEVVGTCANQGAMTCEDAFTMVRCAPDGQGQLTLQRGACAPGARCLVDDAGVARGCDPPF